MKLIPLTRELVLVHQKRLQVPGFAKWWARYVHLVIAVRSNPKLGYTDEELGELCGRAFAALPPELR